MALADVWKLSKYVKDSVVDWTGARLKAIEDFFKVVSFDDLATGMKETFRVPDEMSAEDIAQAPSKILDDIYQNLNKNKVPTVLVLPVVILTSIISGLKTILNIADTTSEKSILQPLRKSIRPALLDAGSTIQARLRKLLTDDEVKNNLAKLGFKDKDIDVLNKLALYIPQAQDIIYFAVREVYNDAVVSRFGQDSNLSQVLAATKDDRAAAGLTDEQFSKYWKAHWELPSVNQGIEAFQRGVIDRTALDMLFQAKDVMPFWRNALLGIAYNLLTRVDVRRMHKLGIMTEQQVTASYIKMGHSPEDAALLTRFTVEYNKSPETQDQTAEDTKKLKEKDLTKSEIVSAYESGIVDNSRAGSMLVSLGYSSDEVSLILGRSDRGKAREYEDQLISGYGKIYVSGVVSLDDVKKLLQQIPMTPERIEQFVALWNIQRMAKLDMPSRTDILSWLKKKIIDKAEAQNLLYAIGTQDPFVEYYLKGVS